MSRESNRAELEARLSRISTRWSLVAEAHTPDADKHAALSRQALFETYAAASYKYLLGAVRDAEAAEELCHEFAVRFLGGDFHRADPSRGRFRDYLRKVLINLANDYQRSRRDQPRSLPDHSQIAAPHFDAVQEPSFDQCLRAELLDQAWRGLSDVNPTYHAVLSMRVSHPDMSSREIADGVNLQTGKRLSPDTIRKTLERARGKFADLLLQEVSRVCEANAIEQLREELDHLDLLKYCQASLDRWRQGT
jgi:RNA polymerase sigma factor (sigma-70 family)